MWFIIHAENNQKADAFESLEECVEQLKDVKPEYRKKFYLNSSELKLKLEGLEFACELTSEVWFVVRKEGD